MDKNVWLSSMRSVFEYKFSHFNQVYVRSCLKKTSAVRRVVSCGHFADKEVLQMRTSAFFGTKTSDFSKFMVCPNGQGGKGGGMISFLRFCVDVFYGRPLMCCYCLCMLATNDRDWSRTSKFSHLWASICHLLPPYLRTVNQFVLIKGSIWPCSHLFLATNEWKYQTLQDHKHILPI